MKQRKYVLPIDWADVNARLANYRKQSLDFLTHALADG